MQNPAIYITSKAVIVSFEHNRLHEEQLHGVRMFRMRRAFLSQRETSRTPLNV